MSGTPAEVVELCQKVSKNCLENGAEIISVSQDASRTLTDWLSYLEHQKTGTADCLLAGTVSALREGVACLCLGLSRPALHSLRLQIDLLLGWIYFKDHVIEWQRIDETGDGYKIKNEIMRYLADSYAHFSSRFGTLKECRTRQVEDPYRLLSAHIHGQSQYVLPNVDVPSDIVADKISQREVVELQAECAEFLGDILWSVYADRWASIPEALRDGLLCRFVTDKQRATFFEPP